MWFKSNKYIELKSNKYGDAESVAYVIFYGNFYMRNIHVLIFVVVIQDLTLWTTQTNRKKIQTIVLLELKNKKKGKKVIQ